MFSSSTSFTFLTLRDLGQSFGGFLRLDGVERDLQLLVGALLIENFSETLRFSARFDVPTIGGRATNVKTCCRREIVVSFGRLFGLRSEDLSHAPRRAAP